MNAFDEEESDWNSSKIKGFSFGDDDETPWAELAKCQTISDSTSGNANVLISFEASSSSSASTGVVSDRVKKAARIFAASGANQDQGGASISDVVGASSDTSNDYLPTDPRELRSELAKARRQLSKLEQSRFTPLHPRETVHNIFFGKKFSLEFYKSFQDKTDLIDEALKLQDGDAILTIALFLRQTLSASKFLELMSTRPVAVRHLANYLETKQRFTEVTDLLSSLGQHERAALIQYGLICKETNLETKARRIKAVLNSHFHGNPDAQLLVSHHSLLERILPVIEADSRNVAITSDRFLPELNTKNETVLGTLLYFCYHHYDAGENLLSSPIALKKMHQIGEQQFVWTALTARAKRHQWKECEALVVAKSWLSVVGKKAKATVDPAGVVKILHQNGAPIELLQNFLQLIDDIEEREERARQFQVHHVVIECLVQQRDRLALEKYRERLTAGSSDRLFADYSLNTSNTKWKN